jgi:hypothetical protein
MAHSGWRVTAQVTDQIINTDAGQTVTGVQVYFVTGDGNSGSVFIANRHYGSAKHVRAVLHAAAQQLDSIGQLSAGPAAGDQPDAF